MNFDPFAPIVTDTFTPTAAVRPTPGSPIRPTEGYQVRVFRDKKSRLRLPMLTAAVSADRLFDAFMGLVEVLGDVVHVVLESSHSSKGTRHRDFRRNLIDAPVLLSHLCEFEDLLLDDGCTGVAVLSARRPIEVQFDEHKLLYVYAPKMKPFRRVLKELGVPRREVLPLVSEAEHLHYSTEVQADRFKELCLRVGVGDVDRVFRC
ncbi:MAG TPA: hypothetical protein VGJ05_04050 [Fimbriiglobus sp.]